METEQNKTELRSGKVRNIIGQIPPFWVRTGTVVIILILIALGYTAWKVPYPFTVEGRRNRREDRSFWIPGEYRKI
jgi:hypothetical protein